MTRNTSTEPDNGIIGLSGHAAKVSARRKLAIGKEILARGPVTGTTILAITRAAGVPAESPAYPNTLRQVGFLAQEPGRPVRWTLTPRGRAWVEAIIAGEQVIAAAKEVAT